MAASRSLLMAPRRARAVALVRTHGPALVVAFALAFLCWCTLTTIPRPGLHYDEVLFVNAALGGDYANGGFVAARFHDVVTMLMPYMGALKAWVWAPVFGVFGVSAETIRVPAVLLLVVTVVLAFLFARRLLGAWPAALLAVLMATDPAFMTMAKTDFGPVALSALLRVGALAAWFGWARSGSARWLWLLAAVIALGLFNKIDFLAFAAGLAFAAVVVDHRGIAARVRARPLASLLPALALLPVLVVEYREIYVPARDLAAATEALPLGERLDQAWGLFRSTMDGTFFYGFVTSTPLDHGTAITAATVVAVALALALVTWRLVRLGRPLGDGERELAEAAKTTAFVLVTLVVSAAALVATPNATGPHHAILLWPLPALLIACVVAAAAQLPRREPRIAVTALLVTGAAWLAVTQIDVADAYRSRLAHEGSWTSVWTTDVYPLSDAVERKAPGVDLIVATDWGVGMQLLALGDDDVRRRLDDAWGTFAGGQPPAIDELAGRLEGVRSILILHVPAAEVMPQTRARARALMRRLRPARGVVSLHRGPAFDAYLLDDRPRGD